MVDPVGPSGSVQNISSLNRQTQKHSEEMRGTVAEQDSVSISEEAVILADVEQLSAQVGTQIAEDTDLALSNNAERLNALI